MYPRKKPHFFPENEGMNYRDLSLVKHAYENKQFGKIYAKAKLANFHHRSGSEKPKILALDEEQVSNEIQRKLIRCTGEEQELKEYFKSIDGGPIDVSYP